jgi:NAD(P)-dependent dehydrogenase (short-subunit alcohol dehydrogenase family)
MLRSSDPCESGDARNVTRSRESLDGRVAIVTGAASGIGRATAHELAEQGVKLVLCDLDGDELARAADDVAAHGGVAHPVAGDVADPTTGAQLASVARRQFGALHVVVNNAAVGAFDMTVETTSLEEWRRVLDVNLTSVFLVCKNAVPLLRESGGGSIVNVSSIHAFASSTGVTPYVAAKGGVLALSRSMALDFAADRIRVNAVIPGPVDTPMLHSHAEREGTTLEALGFSFESTKVGRVADPRELARAIAFLASDDASFITGAPLIVDGGVLAGF